MSEPVSDEGIAVLWSLLNDTTTTDHAKTTTTDQQQTRTTSATATTTDHAKTTTTDHDAIEKDSSEEEVVTTMTDAEWGECIKRWNEHEARKKKRCHATAATERTTTDHAKTRTTDADAITNTNAAQDIPRTQLLSLTTQHLIDMMD